MVYNKNAMIYFDAQMSFKQQEQNLQDATLALEEFKASQFPAGVERQLRATQLAQIKFNEQNLYDEKLAELGDAALPVIEDLRIDGRQLEERVPFQIDENRYFEVYLETESKLVFLGPYSRN